MSFGGKPSTPSPKTKPRVDVKSETKTKPRLASSIASSLGDKSPRTKDVTVQETDSSPRSPVGPKTPPAQKSPSGTLSPSKGVPGDNSPTSPASKEKQVKRRTRSSLGGGEETARGLDFSTASPRLDDKKQVTKVEEKKVTKLDDKKQLAKTDVKKQTAKAEDKKQAAKAEDKKQPMRTEERKPFVTGKAESWSPTTKTPPGKPVEKTSLPSAEKKHRIVSPRTNTPKGKAGGEHVKEQSLVGSTGSASSRGSISNASVLPSNSAAESHAVSVVSKSPQTELGKPSSVVEDDIWICRECGWSYPNAHPSAKHRRNHKKHCAEIKAKKAEGQHVHGGSSDEASSDDEDTAFTGRIEDSVVAPVKDEGLVESLDYLDTKAVSINGGPVVKHQDIPASEDDGIISVGPVVKQQDIPASEDGGITSQAGNDLDSDKRLLDQESQGSPSVKARVQELERKCSGLSDSGYISPGIHGSPSKKFSISKDSPHSSPVRKFLLPEASTPPVVLLESELHDGSGNGPQMARSSDGDDPPVAPRHPVSPVIAETLNGTAGCETTTGDFGRPLSISEVASGGKESCLSHGLEIESQDHQLHVSEVESDGASYGDDKDVHGKDSVPLLSHAFHTVEDVESVQDSLGELQPAGQRKFEATPVGHPEVGPLQLNPNTVAVSSSDKANAHLLPVAILSDGNVEDDQIDSPVSLEIGLTQVNTILDFIPSPSDAKQHELLGASGSAGEQGGSGTRTSTGSLEGDALSDVEVLSNPIRGADPSTVHSLIEVSGRNNISVDKQSGDLAVAIGVALGAKNSLGAASETPANSVDVKKSSSLEGLPTEQKASGMPEVFPIEVSRSAWMAPAQIIPLNSVGAEELAARTEDGIDTEATLNKGHEVVKDATETPPSHVGPLELGEVEVTQDKVDSGTEVASAKADLVGVEAVPAQVPHDMVVPSALIGDSVGTEVGLVDSAIVTEVYQVSAPDIHAEPKDVSAPEPGYLDRKAVASPSIDHAIASNMVVEQDEYLVEEERALATESPGITESLTSCDDLSSEGISALHESVVISSPSSPTAHLEDPKAEEVFDYSGRLEVSSAGQNREGLADAAQVKDNADLSDIGNRACSQPSIIDALPEVLVQSERGSSEPVVAAHNGDSNATAALDHQTAGAGKELEDQSTVTISGLAKTADLSEMENRACSQPSVIDASSEDLVESQRGSSEPVVATNNGDSDSAALLDHQSGGAGNELEDQSTVTISGLAKKVEPALSTASAVAIPRSGRESREKELWERLLDNDVRQNASSPSNFFSSEETWKPELEEKLLQNTVLLNADLPDNYPSSVSKNQTAPVGTHISELESDAGPQAGGALSKGSLRVSENRDHADSVVEQSTFVEPGKEGQAECGLPPCVEVPSKALDEKKQGASEESISFQPTSKHYGDQVQSDVIPVEATYPIDVVADGNELTSNSEVSIDNGVKAVEKQHHHRLKNLLEEEHQAEQPNGGTGPETKAVASPKASPFLKRIIERVRSSPPNLGSSKEGSSQSEVAAKRSIFSCQCFSPVK